MFFPQSRLRLFLFRQPTDMRKSFDGLSALVQNNMQHHPMSGDGYIFINRRRDRMKMLVWEATGFVLYYKLLERGTFELPEPTDQSDTIELCYDQLIMLLEGIELSSIRRRHHFHGGNASVQVG